jgi:hypothetical protein
MDCLNQGCYGSSDPTAGATLQGLSVNTVTFATNAFGHGYPFSPEAGEFPGTDQIYVGSSQTGSHDGYSTVASRINGPQILTLNYSGLVPGGQTVTSLTLGIAADDFQNPVFGQPFTASINGATNTALTNTLNGQNQSGPAVQFFTIGLNPSIDTPSHTLTLSINEGGDGGDGWAVDFLTVGVTTSGTAVAPEPLSTMLVGAGLVGLAMLLRRRPS